MKSEVYNQSTCIVSSVAYLYYIEKRSRAEIAEIFGLSPSTLSRLLKRAKDEKIVEIRMAEPYFSCNVMEREIAERFALKNVIVVPVPEKEQEKKGCRKKSTGRKIRSNQETTDSREEEIKKQVALEGARYIQRIIKDGDMMGLNWGGTMYHLIQYLNPCRKVGASIITMHGSIANCDPKLAVKTLVARAAMAFGGRNVSLTAPGLYDSAEELNKVRQDPRLKSIFALFEKIDISVSGVGSLYPDFDSLLVTAGYLSPEEARMLKEEAAYSDILLRFVDKDGRECDTSLRNRTLSIDMDTYKKIPCKIIVASGAKKAMSVLALLKGGLADVLVIDFELAKQVLSLAGKE